MLWSDQSVQKKSQGAENYFIRCGSIFKTKKT